MAKVRMVAPAPRRVPGLGGRVVQVDEVVTVPDREFESYVCQRENWRAVEEPKPKTDKTESPRAAMKTTARRAAKDGD